MCLFTVVEDSGWIMVAPLQGPEVDGAAGLAVAVRPDGLHLKKHEKSKQELLKQLKARRELLILKRSDTSLC